MPLAVFVCLKWNSLVGHAMPIRQLFTKQATEVTQHTFLFSAEIFKIQNGNIDCMCILFLLSLTTAKNILQSGLIANV